MNNLSWSDVSAYLDWAALRPMTELEYEKVCRGPETRIAGEYPWGSVDINPVQSYNAGVINDFLGNETFTPATNGSCVVASGNGSGLYGPLKVGVFATGSSGRTSAGAAYFGAMEMAGNVSERVVVTANASGTAFTGNNGDGTITATGFANQTSWPDPTTAIGVGFKGSDSVNAAARARTSDRGFITTVDAARGYLYGGRGVR